MIVDVSMKTGIDVFVLLDMDTFSLNSLASSVYRSIYANKHEDAWTAMLAAQGKSEDMEKWSERWKDIIGGSFSKAASGMSKLISKVGKGF